MLLSVKLSLSFRDLTPYQLHDLQVFPPSLWVVFILFPLQKFLSLSRSHLFIFAFIYIILGDGSKMMLLWFMSESVLPVFSS